VVLVLAPEAARSNDKRNQPGGFYDKFCAGIGLDVGYKGVGVKNPEPIPGCIGVDTGYPGYDGKTLPFPENAVDFVFSSHVLEHIEDPLQAIKDWVRVARSTVVIIVPHQFLYEKRKGLPSRFNQDHKRFYTPGKLLSEIEQALAPNSYRVLYLRDNDEDFNYKLGPDKHSDGSYEIECVIKKIEMPGWELA